MKISKVFILNNGLCAVYDDKENQIPRLQGVWKEKYRKVFLKCDSETIIFDFRTK